MLPIAFTHIPVRLHDQWLCLVPGYGVGHVIAATTLAGLPVSVDVRIGAAVHRGVSFGLVRRLPDNVVAFPGRRVRRPELVMVSKTRTKQ